MEIKIQLILLKNFKNHVEPFKQEIKEYMDSEDIVVFQDLKSLIEAIEINLKEKFDEKLIITQIDIPDLDINIIPSFSISYSVNKKIEKSFSEDIEIFRQYGESENLKILSDEDYKISNRSKYSMGFEDNDNVISICNQNYEEDEFDDFTDFNLNETQMKIIKKAIKNGNDYHNVYSLVYDLVEQNQNPRQLTLSLKSLFQ